MAGAGETVEELERQVALLKLAVAPHRRRAGQ
jgi:hypothetical protein